MANQVVTTSTSANTLGIPDILKGALLAVISAVLTVIENSLAQGTLTFNWKAIGIVAATTAVSYLLKNLFTPATTTIKTADGAAEGSSITVQIPAPGKSISESIRVTPKQ